jgi:sugar/nucleoside kinase (ribokinase family)
MTKIRSLGVSGVAVTLGEQGSLIDDGVQVLAVPAMKVNVVDTTGCGDGFDAGFILGLLVGASPHEAAWIGTVCGGLVATGLGSDAGIVDLEQVRGLVAGMSADESAQSAARRLSNNEEK